jgi:hypothetical protein
MEWSELRRRSPSDESRRLSQTPAALLLYAVVLARVLRTRDPGLAVRLWYPRLVPIWHEVVMPW